jgi:hypothetical protein
MNTKSNKIIYWVSTALVAFVLTASAMGKLLSGEQAAEMAKGVGGLTHLKILGFLELAIVALWLFPKTGVVGALLAIAYMGGAIAVHFTTNQPVIVPVIIQIVIWLVAAYRFPELVKRLLGKDEL